MFTKPPNYTKGKINRAGEKLLEDETDEEALTVLSEWRACHAYPINTFQATLRDKIAKFGFGGSPIVAQRLKRAPTIIDKLRREPTMNLSQMQDIGGIRAVLNSVEDVYTLANSYKNPSVQSRFAHSLKWEKDYIQNPRSVDGYRSLHFIYEYKNRVAPEYDGLLLEIQFRTKLQHTWATAVETMGLYLNQPLKSRKGDQQWLDFFALTSSAFAHLEKLPLIPRFANLNKQQTFQTLKTAEESLRVIENMLGFSYGIEIITSGRANGYYHLITLRPTQSVVEVESFAKKDFNKAKLAYSRIEEKAAKGESIEPVLVAAGSLTSLQKAYPNFFLDARAFAEKLREIKASV